MKLVKPMAVSFGFRTFLIVRKQQLCVTSLVGFKLGAGIRYLLPDIALWPAIGEAVGGIVDDGLPKARGEVLVHGSCYAPGGVPVPSSTVRVCVAVADADADARPMMEKKLTVFGDRYWEGTASRGPTEDPVPSTSRATAPVPFTEMPIKWERAFGGPAYKKNPLGRGIDRVDTGDDIWRVPLPNVELPSSLVLSSSQRPEPAGFGPLDVSWPQRQSLAGTYDQRWLEEDFPGYARDTDVAFFNLAQPDQRIDGVFRGDEDYLLENMHPTTALVRGRLPGAAARVLLQRKGSENLEEVKMTLDTLVFLPAKEVGILVFRGTTPVLEEDATDIAVVLAACEDLDAPRPGHHYAQSLARRLDKSQSPLLALNQDDLLPSFAAGTGLAELIGKVKDPTKELRERVFKRAIERARKHLVDMKVPDPDAVLAKMTEKPPLLERLERLPDPADPKDLAEYVAAFEQWRVESEKKQEDMLAVAKEKLEEAEKKLNQHLDRGEAHAPPRRRNRFSKHASKRAPSSNRPGECLPASRCPTGCRPAKGLRSRATDAARTLSALQDRA